MRACMCVLVLECINAFFLSLCNICWSVNERLDDLIVCYPSISSSRFTDHNFVQISHLPYVCYMSL